MAVPVRSLLIDGEQLDARVERALVGGEILRSMDGASRLTMEIDDPDRVILESGVLAKSSRGRVRRGLEEAPWQRIGKVQLAWEGTFWRLAGAPFEGSKLTLEWEPEVIVKLRAHREHFRQQRTSYYSQADFIAQVLRKAGVPVSVLFDQGRRLPVKDDDDRDSKARPGRRGISLNARLFGISGTPLGRDRIRNANRALRQAVKDGAGERATLALIEACLVEAPDFANPTGGDSSSVGILQLLDTHLNGSTSTNGGRRDIELVVHLFLTQGFTGQGGAIALARSHPDWSPGRIAQACQGSAFPDRYEQQRENAEAILEAFGGTERTVTVRRHYTYHAGNHAGVKEDWFESVQRLADEIDYRCFESQGRFYFGSDVDLLRSQPVIALVERWKQSDPLGTFEVGQFESGEWDYGHRASSLKFTAAMPDERAQRGTELRFNRWSFAPGHVADVRRMGPYTGRWLVFEIRQGITDELATFTLTKPSPPKPEPAARTSTITAPDPESGGTFRDRIIAACKRAYEQRSAYHYVMTRPYGPLFGPRPRNFDCSSFVAAVYKHAGVKDPNGLGYSGQGYTGTLWAHGTRVDRPEPGDLAFFGSPAAAGGSAHVNIYAGKVGGVPYSYNMGPSAGLSYGPTMVRNDFVAYKRMDLSAA